MDTLENQIPENDHNIQQEVPQQPAQEAPVKKVSPFADSPYVPQASVEAPKKVQKPRKKGSWKKVLCAVLAVAALLGAAAGGAAIAGDMWEDRIEQMERRFDAEMEALRAQVKAGGVTIVPGTAGTQEGYYTPSQVYAMNVQSIVMISCQIQTADAYGTSTGSGFVISEDGYIVTNYHVVEGSTKITVQTNDGTQYTAKIIGYESLNDVALLKVEAQDMNPAVLGSSDDLIVGDQVAAIGYPLGTVSSTLTVGYVSAKERDVNTSGFAVNMLQTDAAINSGNSGGPLFNMKGEVIGITTAKYSGTSSSGASIEGVGFAIPINDIADLLTDLMTNGQTTGAYLGVSVSDLDASAAEYMGITTGGAYVESAEPGYCAQKAGIRAKDIIVAIGEYEVRNVSELTRVLWKFKPGDITTVTVYRAGQKLTLNITLDEKPQQTSQAVQQPSFPEETPEGDFSDWYEYFFPFFGN